MREAALTLESSAFENAYLMTLAFEFELVDVLQQPREATRPQQTRLVHLGHDPPLLLHHTIHIPTIHIPHVVPSLGRACLCTVPSLSCRRAAGEQSVESGRVESFWYGSVADVV